MVVPRSSSSGSTGSGSGNSIEIVVRAKDQASATVAQLEIGFNKIASSAAVAQIKIAAMSAVIAQLAATSLRQLAQVSQVFIGLKTALDTPITRSVFDQIKEGAQSSLSQTQSLSSVLKSVASVGGVAGQGFFGITKTSIIDDVESRFDKVSAKITGKLVDGFTNLPIENLPIVNKLIPPGALEQAVGPLDKTLSDIVVNQLIGRKIPGALGGVFKTVFGRELGDSIAGAVKGSPIVNVLGDPAKQLLGGTVLGAIESKISTTLTSAFKLGFVNADSFITTGATALGKRVGTAILSEATTATADNFALFDRLVGGNASKFIATTLPKLSKDVVEKSGALQAVRGLTGELVNLISGSLVTGLTGGAVSGGIGQALFQVLGDDLAARGIKNLSGGVLVKIGEQMADITQLTTGARVGLEALFTAVGTSTVKNVGSNIATAIFGTLEAAIPPQIKQLFGLLESVFPDQIAGLKERVIDIVGNFVGDTITNFTTSKVDQLQARVNELNSFIESKGGTPVATAAPIDSALQQQLDLAARADAARERVAELNQELADLQAAPNQIRNELVQVQLDTTLDPAEKARLITDLTAQIQAAEAALESPTEILKARLRELEAIIDTAPASTTQPTAPIPAALEQELNLALEAEDATTQIAALQAELDSLNTTPLRLQEDLARLDLDTTLSTDVINQLKDDITRDLAATEAAIAPRVAEINREISRLGDVVAASPRSVAEVFQEIQDLRIAAIPVDTQEVTEARTKITGLVDELKALENQPALLKEELVQVQLDTEIPDAEKRELVANLTRDIRDAEAVLQNPIAQIQSEIAALNTVIASTPKVVSPDVQPGEPLELVDAPEVEQARRTIAALNDEIAEFQAQPDILKEQRIQAELDTSIPDDERQALVDNLTSQIQQAEAILQNPIGRIRQEITDLNNVIESATIAPTPISIDIDTSAVTSAQGNVANLDNALTDVDQPIVIHVNATQVASAEDDLTDLANVTNNASQPITIDVDAAEVNATQVALNNLDTTTEPVVIAVDDADINTAQNNLNDLNTDVAPINIDVNDDQVVATQTELNALNTDVEPVNINVDATSINNAQTDLDNLDTDVAPVVIDIDASQITNTQQNISDLDTAINPVVITVDDAEINATQNNLADLDTTVEPVVVNVDSTNISQASLSTEELALRLAQLEAEPITPQSTQSLTSRILDLVTAAESAREEIVDLESELEILNETPVTLQNEIAQINEELAALGDGDLQSEGLVERRTELTAELTATQAAIAPRIAEIQEEIAKLNNTIALAPVGTVDEIFNQIPTTPIQIDASVNVDTAAIAQAQTDINAIDQTSPDIAINVDDSQLQNLNIDLDTTNNTGLVEQFEAAEKAREEIIRVRQELADLQAEPLALREELVRVTLDAEIPDDQKQELVNNLTQSIREAELALRDPITRIQTEIAELNNVIGQSPTTVDDLLRSQLPADTTQNNAPTTPSLSPEELDAATAAFNEGQQARQEIAFLQQELQRLANTPSALRNQRDDIQIFNNLDFKEKLSQLNDLDGRLANARSQQAQIAQTPGLAGNDRQKAIQDLDTEIRRIEQQRRRVDVVLLPDLKPEQKAKFIEELNEQIKSAEALLESPVINVQTQLITAQEELQSLPVGNDASVKQIDRAKQLNAEIASLSQELEGFQSRPIEIKEQLVRLQLDTGIDPEEQGKLADNLRQELEEAEAALANPISRIQQQIIELNQIVASAPQILPTANAGVQPQTIEDFEAIEAARAEIAALQGEITALNSNPITLRADLERAKLDTTISEEEKSALIANLTQQITAAETAIQSPLQRLALQIVGIIGNASSESGGTLIIDIERIFNQVDDFLEGTLSDSFTEIGKNAAGGFAKGLGDSLFQELSPIIDEIDGFILGTIDKIKSLPGTFTEPLGQVSGAFTAIAGVNEPLALFQGIQEKAGAAFAAISQVGEQITFFQSGFETLKGLITNGPFELLIGQNIRLNEQLLATKASLVSTNKVVDGFAGQEISDPTKAIQSLDAPVNDAIDRIRKGSLKLSGVTSSQLIEGFQVIASQAGSIGLSLEQSADTTLSFAAALGTLGVPLDQARQEVTSILTAQITSDSVVAKSLGITNEQVRLYKSQGQIFQFLEGKLAAFKKGNELASETIGGYSSNIQEIFETIALNAGRPLLAPITAELKGIYDYLSANQEAITASIGAIALNLFEGVKAAFDALKVVGKAFEGVLVQIPDYLFTSLSNVLKVVAESAINTVNALTPMINVFSQLFEFIRPLAGPFLQIAIQAKALQIGIGLLGNSFGFLSNLLPGVGELLFGVNARTLPMVNLFPALAGSLGSGAAGFLLLGQNMNAIPGVAGAVIDKLSLFGPLSPLIAGVIPSLAGVGITIAGLAKNFPPLQNGLDKIFAANPADLISGLKAFTGLVPGFGFLNPLLDAASDRVRVLAGNQSLSAFATTQFNIALKAAAIQLRNFLVSTALLGAGLFLAFQAVDKFILKNEQLLETLKNITQGLQLALQGLVAFATNPFFAGISITIGVAIVAANGLHVALLRLIATQLAGWAVGVSGALSQLSGFLSLIRISSLATGAAQASTGLQALAIAMTQGSAASAQFLASNGINVVTLGTLQASLTATIAKIRLFIVETVRSAVTNIRSFVGSIIAASSALMTRLLTAIPAAIAGLIAMRTTTTTTSFSFATLATSIQTTATKLVTGIIGAAKGAVASLIAMATGANTGAFAFGTLSTSIGTTLIGLATLLAPILAVVGVIGLLGAAFQAKRLEDSNEAVEQFTALTDQAATGALETAQKLKSAKDAQTKRTKDGIKLTDEEYAANKRLVAQAEERKKRIDEQVASLEDAKKTAASDENKANLESQIAQLKKVKETLNSLSSNIQLAPKELPRLGTAFEQLAEKAKSAGEAIKNSSGDPEIFKQKASELIEITNTQLEQGQITAEAARDRLNALASSETVDFETQIKAQQAITESYKAEAQDQVETKQAAQEKIQAGIASGRVKEIDGEKQLTALKNEELQIQLEAAEAAYGKRVNIINKEFQKTQEFLNKQLAARQKEADSARPQDKDTKLKAVQLAQTQIEEAEAAHNESLGNLAEDFGNERTKLAAQQEKNVAEGAKREQEARLKSVESATKKAADATQKAETDRLIQTQRLANAGKLTQSQVEEAKIASANASNKAQIEAEAKKQTELEALIKSAPTDKAREELEEKLRESRLKTQDLTLKSLEGEQKAHEAHIATVKSALEKTNTTEQIAIEKRVNDGQATETEAADLRADQKVKSLNAEIGLEKEGSEKRLKLELELQQAIRAARDSESAKRKEELVNTQTEEQIALEKRINDGQATEAQAADLTADQKVAQLQQELSLEGLTKTKRLQLELELQKSIRSARDAESAKRKEELATQQAEEELALEKRITAGETSEAEAADLSADQRVEQLQQELSLETTNKAKRLQLEIELQKAIRSAREAEKDKRRADLEDEQNAVLLSLQKQLNAGEIGESEISKVRASQKVEQLQQELSLETSDKSKRLKLELDLQQAIKEAQDAELADRKSKLEQANQAAQNQIDAQNQALRQQGEIFNILTQAMDNRNRLLQAGANLIKAQSEFAVNELNILAQGETSEFRKRQLAEITAAIKLEALQKEQVFQRQSLQMELEKQRLAVANEKIQNRIQQGEQRANIAKAKADLDIAQLDPKTSKPQLEALQIKLQAEVDKGSFLEAQTGLIDQKAAIGEKEIAIKQAQQGFEQRSALRGAQAELARTLPPGQRNRAERAVRQLVAEDLGAENYEDLRSKGLAKSRSIAAQNLGNVVTAPVVFDGEQYDMARKLQGVQNTFGKAALTPAPDTLIPSGTQPLALPQVDLKGLGISFENSGQAFVSGIDKLVNALDTKLLGNGQNINVSLTTPNGTQTSAITTTQQPQVINLEEVVKFSKQLLGV